MRFAFLVVCAMAMAAVYGVHHHVIAQITSGEPRIALQQAPPLLSGPIDFSNFHVGLPIDEKEIARFNAENLASQIQDSNRRMEKRPRSKPRFNAAACRASPPDSW